MAINILTKGLKYLEIPPFYKENIPHLGNSFCIFKFFFYIDKKITFPRILHKPVGSHFTPVIWWLDDDGNVHRQKLWISRHLVLYEGKYDNHIIKNTFAIEIWPDVGVSVVSFPGMNLETSFMVIPEIGCPVDFLTAADYNFILGTDPVMDVGTYTWNGVRGDSWSVDPYGFTTFNEGA